jgi:hypothetical protein
MDEQAQRQLVLCEQNRQLAAQAAAVREELAAAEAACKAAGSSLRHLRSGSLSGDSSGRGGLDSRGGG